jgi:hypothetical protein
MSIRTIAALAFSLMTMAAASSARPHGAIICASDSKGACAGRQYCCYSGSESDGDKYCQSLGCHRGGTSSCPTAANVKSCGTRNVSMNPPPAKDTEIAWCFTPTNKNRQSL